MFWCKGRRQCAVDWDAELCLKMDGSFEEDRIFFLKYCTESRVLAYERQWGENHYDYRLRGLVKSESGHFITGQSVTESDQQKEREDRTPSFPLSRSTLLL